MTEKNTMSVRLGNHIKRYLLLFTLVPMLMVSLLCTFAITGYYDYSNQLEIEYSVANLQRELSDQMENWKELLQTCAETEEIILQLDKGRALDEDGQRLISALLAGRGKSIQLHLISANGRFRYSTGAIPNVYQMPTFNEWPFFACIRQKGFAVRATNLISFNAHPLALSMGAAVCQNDRVIGYTILDVEQSEILDLLLPYRSVDISDILLISNDSKVVCSLSGRQKTGLLLSDEIALTLVSNANAGKTNPRSGYVAELREWAENGLTLVVVRDHTSFFRFLPAILIGFALLVLCAVGTALLTGNALSKRVTGQLSRLPDANRLRPANDAAEGYVRQEGDFEEIVSIGEELNQLNRQTRVLLLSNREKEQLLDSAEQNLLRAQMRPHMIYNVLNDIKSMAKLGRCEQIVSLIVSFSALLRSTLSVHEEFATLSEEVELAEKYVRMQNLRGSCPAVLKLNIQEGLGEVEIPRLMLQPLIENAMLHGLMGHPRPVLSVSAKREVDQLIVQVTDNGKGLREATRYECIDGAACHEGVGLKNIAKRLKLYYGSKGRLLIRSKPRRYTAVSLCIPFKSAEKQKNNDETDKVH